MEGVTRIVLPTALAGLVTGVMLAVARVIGETAPLLVTTGVIDSVNTNPLSGRMQNLAVYAYSEYKDPGVDVQASYDKAWAAALTLILIVMILSLLARWIYRRTEPTSASQIETENAQGQEEDARDSRQDQE